MRTLSRKAGHRNSLMRNLATSLLLYESIETTTAKAKEVKSLVDSIIPRAKKADLASIKYLNSILFDKNAVKKVTDELVPRYAERSSGFVRIYKTGNRLGDNAQRSIVELVDKKVFVEKAVTKTDSVKKATAKKVAPTKVSKDK